MNNATLTITALTALLLVGAGTAMARGPGGEGGPPSFEELDADGSGEITSDDIALLRESRFAEIDTNGDGAVSEAEFVAHASARAGERAARQFVRLDADGDGSLSRDALEARGGRGMGDRMLSRLDEDGSGGVSAEEFEAGMERFAERRGKRGKRGGGQGWGRGQN